MPRVSQPKKGTHPHPDYLYGYVFERAGVWHTSVHGHRRSTALPAKRQHLMQAMEILTERINEYKQAGSSGQAIVKQAPATTHTAMQEFLQQKKLSISENTLNVYVRTFRQFLPEPILLADYKQIRADILHRISNSNFSVSYQRKMLQRLTEYLNYCVRAGHCEINPLAAVKKPAPVLPLPVVPTAEEVKNIIEYFRTGHWYVRMPFEREQMALYAEFLSMSAVRPGEALKLTSRDVDTNGLTIDGKRSKHTQPRMRYIPFRAIPGLEELVQRILSHSREQYLFAWRSTHHPNLNFKTAVSVLGYNTEYVLYSLRAYAKNWWEKVLGMPFDLSNMLAGHSFAVRANYVATPTMSDMLEYSARAEYVRNSK